MKSDIEVIRRIGLHLTGDLRTARGNEFRTCRVCRGWFVYTDIAIATGNREVMYHDDCLVETSRYKKAFREIYCDAQEKFEPEPKATQGELP